MEVILIAHDVRSAHNIGSLARSADSFGIKTIYCTGITPYIKAVRDDRLPHIQRKVALKISKTSLGAEKNVNIFHSPDINSLILDLKLQGFSIVAIEQHKFSKPLKSFDRKEKIALVLGSEKTGLLESIIALCDDVLEIPMIGTKESLNVSVAGAISMYELKRSELY